MFADVRHIIRTVVIAVAVSGTPTNAADVDGLLLTTKFGELCTTCKATLECVRGEKTTLYAFGERTFLSQMSTVLDFVPGLRQTAKVHTRPVTVTSGASVLNAKARFDLGEARIDLPDIAGQATQIERRTGAWTAGGSGEPGKCSVPK